MSAILTDAKLHNSLERYKAHYLNKKFENLGESSTRIIINHLLTDVFGYKELYDIKTEYPIQGGYIDYLIELNRNKKLVIEAKSISTNFTNKHLRQAIYYGATVGSDWIILTNARTLDLYKIKYSKPLRVTRMFSIDFKKLDPHSENLASFLTKRSVLRGDLDNFSKIYEELARF
jgi:hypothetical protein